MRGRMTLMPDGSRPTREDVVAAYHVLLGREPESEEAICSHLGAASVAEMIRGFGNSSEFQRRISGASPFFHYNASIDVRAIVERHTYDGRRPMEGHLVNFLGVAMSTRFMPHIANRGGQLDEIPIPANYHADMAEWASALRAVELANRSFSMIELGCGWGCWMNNTGVVAKRRGLKVHVIGIEADEGHLEFAREALATNGIAASEYTLLRGVAAARPGFALFPRQDAAGGEWGLEPVFNATATEVDEALSSGKFDKVCLVPLEEALGDRKEVDLLHIDIQGGEADLVRDSMDLLKRRVGYMVIGTHSREIEGRLFGDLLTAGWIIEVERPAIFTITPHGPQTTVDGVQGWRNPRLRHG